MKEAGKLIFEPEKSKEIITDDIIIECKAFSQNNTLIIN